MYEELEPDGNLERITALIEAGYDIHQGMPLLPAVSSGNLAIVKLLVESGVNVNKIYWDDEETALFRGHLEQLPKECLIMRLGEKTKHYICG